MWRIIERDVIREGGDEGEGWRSARIFRAATNSVLCNIYTWDILRGIYRVLTPADSPRARRLSIWLPLHSDV